MDCNVGKTATTSTDRIENDPGLRAYLIVDKKCIMANGDLKPNEVSVTIGL